MTSTEEFAQRITLLTPCELSALIDRLSALAATPAQSPAPPAKAGKTAP